jgi:hypothetical protein
MPAQMTLLLSAKLGGNRPSIQMRGQALDRDSEGYCKLEGLRHETLVFQTKITSV